MKITIMGVGHVGTTLAYNLMLRGLADHLVLVNRTMTKAQAEASDLQHAAAFASKPVRITAGDIQDTADSQIIVLTLSVPVEKHFRSRNDLARGNASLFAQVVPQLVSLSPEAIFIVVSNPVEVMTTLTMRYGNLPASRVIGTGTLIDSARYRSLLSNHLQVHPDDIRAYIFGEHGETQFPALSIAATGGERMDDDPIVVELFEKALASGEQVFRLKGYTNYAIASATSMIVEGIVMDSHRTIPVSAWIDGYEQVHSVCLYVPAIIGRRGVVKLLQPKLTYAEGEKFRHSARQVQSVLDTLEQVDASSR